LEPPPSFFYQDAANHLDLPHCLAGFATYIHINRKEMNVHLTNTITMNHAWQKMI